MPSIQPEDTALWLNLLHEGYDSKCSKIFVKILFQNKIRAAFRYWKLLREQERLNSVQIFTILVSMLIMLIKK